MNIKTKLLEKYVNSYDVIKSKQNTYFKINIFLCFILIFLIIFLLFKYIVK